MFVFLKVSNAFGGFCQFEFSSRGKDLNHLRGKHELSKVLSGLEIKLLRKFDIVCIFYESGLEEIGDVRKLFV